MIGLIGALEIEMEGLCARMEQIQQVTVSGLPFYRGRIGGVDCVVSCCGPGKVNAAVCAQAMILRFSPQAVINLGVAGGVGEHVRIGDLVIADAVVQHDVDTTALGDEKGFLSRIGVREILADETLVSLFRHVACASYPGTVHVGVVATGDQFIASRQTLEAIAGEFGAIACEMEGGSVGQVCYMNHTPFAVLRAISDGANEAAELDYPAFAAQAAARSCALLLEALPKIRMEEKGEQ